MVLFGGFTGQQVCQEVLLLDPHTLKVQPVASSACSGSAASSKGPGAGAVPPARFAHSAAVVTAAAGLQVRLRWCMLLAAVLATVSNTVLAC